MSLVHLPQGASDFESPVQQQCVARGSFMYSIFHILKRGVPVIFCVLYKGRISPVLLRSARPPPRSAVNSQKR